MRRPGFTFTFEALVANIHTDEELSDPAVLAQLDGIEEEVATLEPLVARSYADAEIEGRLAALYRVARSHAQHRAAARSGLPVVSIDDLAKLDAPPDDVF